jgi:general stress protein 26
MTVVVPDLASIEADLVELLRTEQVATLATLAANGYPSASAMHIAADGLVVYLSTLTRHRKYAEMLADARVSYVVYDLPDGGFAARREVRSLQVQGVATLVTEPAELERAVTVSREQFPWLAETTMYRQAPQPDAGPMAFFRVRPVEAVWSDHRVRQQWRTCLTFTADGRAVADMREYGAD